MITVCLGSASASELEDMKRKQRKLLQLVDKYEQLSSLHLTAMAKNDSVVSDLLKVLYTERCVCMYVSLRAC